MEVPASEHRLVALAIMETYVRYCRVLQHSPQCLPVVLQTFVGDRGIGHPDKASPACLLMLHSPLRMDVLLQRIDVGHCGKASAALHLAAACPPYENILPVGRARLFLPVRI